jgi:cell cycle checkpoint control protein RAD9A
LSAFKGRVVDPAREKDTAVERCDVSVEDGEGKTKSRFIIKIVCRHGKIYGAKQFKKLMSLGVLKTYRLTFESVTPMHALFIKESANNSWSISSKTLREFVEHFGPGTEQLDIYSEDGRVSFTSYTEKIMSGNGL